jgi:hypothetical protein
MSDQESAYPTVKAVLRIIESRLADRYSLDGLHRVEADLLATVTAHGVIGNGGLLSWYEGKNAPVSSRVADGFDRLGLPAAADAMRDSLRAFSDGAPPDDQTARQRYITDHRAELEESFRPLDEAIWDADWDAAAMAYIDTHRAQLVSLSPAYATLLRLH